MILQDPFQMGLLCDPVWVCLYMYETENSDHVKCGGRRCNIYVKVCKRICKKKKLHFSSLYSTGLCEAIFEAILEQIELTYACCKPQLYKLGCDELYPKTQSLTGLVYTLMF